VVGTPVLKTRQIPWKVRITATGQNVSEVAATLESSKSGGGFASIEKLKLVKGTHQNGVWEGTAWLERYAVGGKYYVGAAVTTAPSTDDFFDFKSDTTVRADRQHHQDLPRAADSDPVPDGRHHPRPGQCFAGVEQAGRPRDADLHGRMGAHALRSFMDVLRRWMRAGTFSRPTSCRSGRPPSHRSYGRCSLGNTGQITAAITAYTHLHSTTHHYLGPDHPPSECHRTGFLSQFRARAPFHRA